MLNLKKSNKEDSSSIYEYTGDKWKIIISQLSISIFKIKRDQDEIEKKGPSFEIYSPFNYKFGIYWDDSLQK